MLKRALVCCVLLATWPEVGWCQNPQQLIQQLAPFIQRGTNAAPQQQSLYSQTNMESRKRIQEWLIWIGHYPGPVDGEFGDGTIAAIRKFQTELREPATGILTQQQFTAMSQRAVSQMQQAGFKIVADKTTGI